jgi:hypothetical protein
MSRYPKLENMAWNIWALGMFMFMFGLVMPMRCWISCTTGCDYAIRDPG